MSEAPMSPEELKGKTRAELLELCRARGMKATGWKRDRMFAELTGEAPPPKPASGPDRAAAAEAIAKKQEEAGQPDSDVAPKGAKAKSLKERLASRTGSCFAVGCKCESWIPGEMDVNRLWHMCADCTHTQWVHSVADGSAPPSNANEEGGEEGEGEAEDDRVPGGDADEEEGEPEGDEEGDEEDDVV